MDRQNLCGIKKLDQVHIRAKEKQRGRRCSGHIQEHVTGDPLEDLRQHSMTGTWEFTRTIVATQRPRGNRLCFLSISKQKLV